MPLPQFVHHRLHSEYSITDGIARLDNAKVDVAFFLGNMVRSNFICALSYGDATKLHPRSPRPEFNEVHKIV